MIQAAICDNNKHFTGELERLLQKEANANMVKLDISVFFDGYTLQKTIQQGNRFDLIYLDIKMGKMNGIDTAHFIRKFDFSVLIIYVTAYEQYAKYLFETEPFRLLLKPINHNLFARYFLEAYQRIHQNSGYFEFTYNKEIHKVSFKEIQYFKSYNRKIYIHLANGKNELFYGQLKDVESEMQQRNQRFLRIHQSYLINYDYIRKMNFTSVIIENSDGTDLSLSISENRQKDIRQQLTQFMNRKPNSK